MQPQDRPTDVETVTTALDRLVDWGNLRADPDTARVTAVEDFYRKRFIYQLTRAGEAAEAALGSPGAPGAAPPGCRRTVASGSVR